MADMTEDERIRSAYDISLGTGDDAAWRTRVKTTLDPQGRAIHTRPYEYSAEELQRALDVSNTWNPWRRGIFDYILEQTGSPRMASSVTTMADYTPGFSSVLALRDAEQIARDIPDNYREEDYLNLLKNLGLMGLAVGDAALGVAPVAKPVADGVMSLLGR